MFGRLLYGMLRVLWFSTILGAFLYGGLYAGSVALNWVVKAVFTESIASHLWLFEAPRGRVTGLLICMLLVAAYLAAAANLDCEELAKREAARRESASR
jgi:hypothetical protein